MPIVWFEAFKATKCNKALSGCQSCQVVKTWWNRRFENHLSPRPQGTRLLTPWHGWQPDRVLLRLVFATCWYSVAVPHYALPCLVPVQWLVCCVCEKWRSRIRTAGSPGFGLTTLIKCSNHWVKTRVCIHPDEWEEPVSSSGFSLALGYAINGCT
jgi:hypothetical protein